MPPSSVPTSGAATRSRRPPSSTPTACRSSCPRRSRGRSPPERGDAQELRESEIDIYVHAPYLINVCSPRNNVRYGSRKILQQTCDAAGAIGAAAVVVHPGHAEDGIEAGIGRWPRTLEMLESEVPVLLENTAGASTRSPAASTPWHASGRPSPATRGRSRSASASTPATPTRRARSSPTPSSGRWRSPAGSTSCTPTTPAIRREPAPTATRAWARGRWTRMPCAR